ncbi:MAG TPA: hypothetical protein VFL91_07925 [Thermomicrobiales bacterium]|nr:hypothetical protein [Thermomicrobiales bacterium]
MSGAAPQPDAPPPLSPPPDPPPAPAAEPAAEPAPAPGRAAAPVLVVADEAADRARLALVLRAAGYAPAACAPAAVWAALAAARPALVLLALPGTGRAALALYRRLRADEATAATPVVLLSAVPAAIVAARTADCPPAGLVHRPCPPSAVLAVVARALGAAGEAAPGDADRRRYTVRYRGIDGRGRPALIVTDAGGAAYLYSDGALGLGYPGPDAAGRLVRLARRASDGAAWAVVPRGAPATLAGLRRLVEPAPPNEADR